MGCERQGWPLGPGEFQHLYGTLGAAVIHVGKSPDCGKLRLGHCLGVREISIAAGTGAAVMAVGADAAGQAPYVLHQPPCYPELYLYISVNTYITWDIPIIPGNLGWDIPVLMTYPDISRDIPKLNKNR